MKIGSWHVAGIYAEFFIQKGYDHECVEDQQAFYASNRRCLLGCAAQTSDPCQRSWVPSLSPGFLSSCSSERRTDLNDGLPADLMQKSWSAKYGDSACAVSIFYFLKTLFMCSNNFYTNRRNPYICRVMAGVLLWIRMFESVT